LAVSAVAFGMLDSVRGWGHEEALYNWLIVCGPTRIDEYLLAFIRREVRLRGLAAAARWQDSMSRLYSESLLRAWPMHRFNQLSFAHQQRYARNGEEAMLAVANACALVTNQMLEIHWPLPTSMGEMIKRLQGQRQGPLNVPALGCLSYLNAARQCLDMADLYGSNLHCTDLSYADLNYANLSHADLADADLTGARVLETNVTHALLQGTRLGGLRLQELILESRAASLGGPRTKQRAGAQGELARVTDRLRRLGALVPLSKPNRGKNPTKAPKGREEPRH
jgi:hypothetical protein